VRRTDAETADKTRQAGADMAPVVWLLGKVQSGKSSIIRALTGETAAAVGNGFRPCTRSSAIFDFPA
jgi:GTP-binding protein EngB required for normal cell division